MKVRLVGHFQYTVEVDEDEPHDAVLEAEQRLEERTPDEVDERFTFHTEDAFDLEEEQ